MLRLAPGVVWVVALLLSGDAPAWSEETGKPPASQSAEPDLKQKITQLWADVPDYVAQLSDGKNFKTAPRLQSSVAPLPPALLAPGQQVRVLVSLVIDESGRVEAARVVESSDSQFNSAAINAVRQWQFTPAEGETGAVKAFCNVPINFVGPPPSEERAIGINFGPPAYRFNQWIRLASPVPDSTPHYLNVPLVLTGQSAADVRAGRVIITSARDDTRLALHQLAKQGFYRPAVGSVSEKDFSQTIGPSSFDFSLTAPAPEARHLQAVDGVIELVIPAADSNATVRIEGVATKIGAPIASPALSEAGVKLVIFDQQACERCLTEPGQAGGGPQDYDVGPLFGVRHPIVPAVQMRVPEIMENDLAIGIDDPQGRLVGLEFQTAAGGPLNYNHNGAYHSGDSPGKRFSLYRLKSKLPDDAILVCWLITPGSLFRVPLKLTNLALPELPPTAHQAN